MVFEPTFDEIGREADALPDLSDGGPAPDDGEDTPPSPDTAADADDAARAGDEDATLEGEAIDATMTGSAPADDLPPLGA
jgi:hypothetical protein